jgi:hypothetical protein
MEGEAEWSHRRRGLQVHPVVLCSDAETPDARPAVLSHRKQGVENASG